MQSQQCVESKNYMYIIYCPWSLLQIRKFLYSRLGAEQKDIYQIKIYRKNGKETNSTLVWMNPKIFLEAKKQNFHLKQSDIFFRILPYKLRNHHYPKKHYSDNLFLSFGTNISTYYAFFWIKKTLNISESIGYIPKNSYSIYIPLSSRYSGNNKGFAFIFFKQSVDVNGIAYTRLLLHDVVLSNKNQKTFQKNNSTILTYCNWSRKKIKLNENPVDIYDPILDNLTLKIKNHDGETINKTLKYQQKQ